MGLCAEEMIGEEKWSRFMRGAFVPANQTWDHHAHYGFAIIFQPFSSRFLQTRVRHNCEKPGQSGTRRQVEQHKSTCGAQWPEEVSIRIIRTIENE